MTDIIEVETEPGYDYADGKETITWYRKISLDLNWVATIRDHFNGTSAVSMCGDSYIRIVNMSYAELRDRWLTAKGLSPPRH